MVAEADRLESEKIKQIQNLKNNLMETLAKMKFKEMGHMEKALAKMEQVEFEAEEVVNCDNENDLVSSTKKRPGYLDLIRILSIIYLFYHLGKSYDRFAK